MNTNWHDWKINRDRKHFLRWLEENNFDAKRLDIDSILEEGWRDWAKTAGRIGQGAVMMGALAGPFASLPQAPQGPPASMQPPAAAAVQQTQAQNPFQVVDEDPQEIKRRMDNYNVGDTSMTPQEWKDLASRYPGDRVGFVPDPNSPGGWMPAGGADAVRIQGLSQINNDELTQDTVGTTPYKNGRPMRPTNWSGTGKPTQDLSGYQAQLGVNGMRRGMRRV